MQRLMSFRPHNSSRTRGCYFSLVIVGCMAAGAVLWMVDTGFLSKSQLALPGQYTDLWCRPSNGWCPGDPPSLSSFYLLLSYSDTLPIAFNIALILATLYPPYFNPSSTVPAVCVCVRTPTLPGLYWLAFIGHIYWWTCSIVPRLSFAKESRHRLLATPRQFCFFRMFHDHSSRLNACRHCRAQQANNWFIHVPGEDNLYYPEVASRPVSSMLPVNSSLSRSVPGIPAATAQAQQQEQSQPRRWNMRSVIRCSM